MGNSLTGLMEDLPCCTNSDKNRIRGDNQPEPKRLITGEGISSEALSPNDKSSMERGQRRNMKLIERTSRFFNKAIKDLEESKETQLPLSSNLSACKEQSVQINSKSRMNNQKTEFSKEITFELKEEAEDEMGNEPEEMQGQQEVEVKKLNTIKLSKRMADNEEDSVELEINSNGKSNLKRIDRRDPHDTIRIQRWPVS